jgi:hypothetical protein
MIAALDGFSIWIGSLMLLQISHGFTSSSIVHLRTISNIILPIIILPFMLTYANHRSLRWSSCTML